MAMAGVGLFGGEFMDATTHEVYGLTCAHMFATDPPRYPSRLKIVPSGAVVNQPAKLDLDLRVRNGEAPLESLRNKPSWKYGFSDKMAT